MPVRYCHVEVNRHIGMRRVSEGSGGRGIGGLPRAIGAFPDCTPFVTPWTQRPRRGSRPQAGNLLGMPPKAAPRSRQVKSSPT